MLISFKYLWVVFRTNQIESNWVRFEFDSIESRIEFKRFEFERIEFERFGFDSDSIRFRDYHVTLHKFPKKEIFVFAKIEKLRYTRSHKFPKKEIYLLIIQFDSDSIRIRSIRIRFGFDSIRTESNFINSDSIHRSRIRIESESEFESDSIRRIVCRTLIASKTSFGRFMS